MSRTAIIKLENILCYTMEISIAEVNLRRKD